MNDKTQYIRTYLPEEFEKIPKKNLIEFVGAGQGNVAGSIQATKRRDTEILEVWEWHFRHVKVPYRIEQRGNLLYLIKERRV